MTQREPIFKGGKNIAMKVPAGKWQYTVSFYKDTLGLKVIEEGRTEASQLHYVCFEFGPCNLWIDQIPDIDTAEVWLEVITTDLDATSDLILSTNAKRLKEDEAEKLPEGFKAFWVKNPSGIIHLMAERPLEN